MPNEDETGGLVLWTCTSQWHGQALGGVRLPSMRDDTSRSTYKVLRTEAVSSGS
jgi:hypothetical protein